MRLFVWDSCLVALVTSQVERKLSSVEQWSLVRVREVVSGDW